jgi:hypothetical protein
VKFIKAENFFLNWSICLINILNERRNFWCNYNSSYPTYVTISWEHLLSTILRFFKASNNKGIEVILLSIAWSIYFQTVWILNVLKKNLQTWKWFWFITSQHQISFFSLLKIFSRQFGWLKMEIEIWVHLKFKKNKYYFLFDQVW